MKTRIPFLVFFIVGACLSILIWSDKVPAGSEKVTREELNKHPGKREKNYVGWREKRLFERIQPAPPVLIDLLRKDNIFNGWPQKPESAEASESFKKDIIEAVQEMPHDIRKIVAKKLVGIFIVKDLGGSAFAELVYDEKGEPRFAMVVIDAAALNRTANEWMNWKESSPFRSSKRDFLRATIASVENDNRKNALSYILLHEFGHVISFGFKFDPHWRYISGQSERWGEKFYSLSWELGKNENNIENKGPFIQSRRYALDKKKDPFAKIPYYASDQKKKAPEGIHDIYRHLANSDFPTLYAVMNPGDDFAEVFVNYVHVELLKRPYKIELYRDGKLNRTYRSCWNEIRCQKKKDFLKKFLAAELAR